MNKATLVVSLFLAICLSGCSSAPPKRVASIDQFQAIYTSYNIWVERPEVIHSVNYKKGGILPAGSQVVDYKMGEHRRSKTVTLTTLQPARNFKIFWDQRNHPGQTFEQFLQELLVGEDFSAQVKGLRDSEVQAIKRGEVSPGMSKKAVLVSYGPPSAKETFARAGKFWVYPMHRFRKIKMEFDSKGKVVNSGS
ncbi:MAG: hypothetical protein ABFR97_08345 [Thermodesulfobacteriota bacterium]